MLSTNAKPPPRPVRLSADSPATGVPPNSVLSSASVKPSSDAEGAPTSPSYANQADP